MSLNPEQQKQLNELIERFAQILLQEAYEGAWAEEPEIMREIESKTR